MLDLIGVLLFLAFIVAPIARILTRLGISPLWALICCVPIVNIVALNYAAAATWPFDVIPKTQSEEDD